MNHLTVLDIITIFGVLIILFLIFRPVILWFWKINKQIELLEKNNEVLNNILTELKKDNKKI